VFTSLSQPTKHPRINQNLLYKQQNVLQTTRVTKITAKEVKKARIQQKAAIRDTIDNSLGFIS
jgi:hypothetical protein